jgi:protein tyrosine phosphatase (PTP) superfamily phosphohydrolase (DUF442 family)
MPRSLLPTLRAATTGTLIGLAVAVTAEAVRVFALGNVHAVIPGRVYRCAQPSSEQLARLVAQYGIRTVVNLRGTCSGFDWYADECRATRDLDLSQEDITFSAGRLPPSGELRRLVEVLDQADSPVLIHCRQGVDRTGLTAAVALLLETDTPLDQARRQLSLRYGHVSIGPTTAMLRFFDLYSDWLSGRAHTPELFRRWATAEYCPGPQRGDLDAIEWPQLTTGEPAALHVRAHNTSSRPWRLLPGTAVGIHVHYLVFDAGLEVVQSGYAGLFAATVAPGGQIDLTLALNGLAPGRYLLWAELSDGQECAFWQVGSEPLVRELAVE